MSLTPAAAMPVAVITGAHGGMGIACSRVFGRRQRLVLTDRDPGRLGALREQLEADGVEVCGAVAGNLSDAAVLSQVVEAARAAGRLGALVHTAGLATGQAGWREILEVNLMTTVRLVDAFEPLLSPGAAAVLIASIAGHTTPNMTPELRAALAAVLAGGGQPALDRVIEAAGGEEGMSWAAYGVSKYGVLRLAEARARSWAQQGARITTISPGLISTPMGRGAVEAQPEAGRLLQMTPIQRWGASLDIANAAEFLCSDLAGFVTGCDLRVDGGVVGAIMSATPGAG